MTEDNNPTSLKKWDSRWPLINALIQDYEVLRIFFRELEYEGSERSIDARDSLIAIKQPIFVITFFIVHKVFGIIKILSNQLKANDLI